MKLLQTSAHPERDALKLYGKRYRVVRPKKSKAENEQVRSWRRSWEYITAMDSLHKLGMDDYQERMVLCGRLQGFDCDSCLQRAGRRMFRCGLKVCPYCVQTRAEKLAAKLMEIILKWENPIVIVLTIKNRSSLDDADQHLRQAFKKLRRQHVWLERISGGFAFWETTYNGSAGGWHAHLHILCNGYIDKSLLRAAWYDVTGDSYIVDISHVYETDREKALFEACKYPCKLTSIVGDEGLVAEFIETTKGRRLFWAFGDMYGYGKVLEEAANDLGETEEEVQGREVCPCCGEIGTMVPVFVGLENHTIAITQTVRAGKGWYVGGLLPGQRLN